MEDKTLNHELRQVAAAAPGLALASDEAISALLRDLASRTMQAEADILAANVRDLERMDESDPKYDRLLLNHERLSAIAESSKRRGPALACR
jgi:glutamate-5-semialdehyde dehydrogenase